MSGLLREIYCLIEVLAKCIEKIIIDINKVVYALTTFYWYNIMATAYWVWHGKGFQVFYQWKFYDNTFEMFIGKNLKSLAMSCPVYCSHKMHTLDCWSKKSNRLSITIILNKTYLGFATILLPELLIDSAHGTIFYYKLGNLYTDLQNYLIC